MSDYPGFGLPLRDFPQDEFDYYPMGIHKNCYSSTSHVLFVREVAMMIIMDKLTDKENWQKKVFDEVIVAKWRKEALEYPDNSFWEQATGGKMRRGHIGRDWLMKGITPLERIMSDEAFDYCVEELRNKARYYEKSGLIPTLDACATVVKSDTLISPKLQTELRNAFSILIADQHDSRDWHPNSGEMVQDLVHPSMYPLVYGQSKVFKEEVVGVVDAIERWAGTGEVIAKEASRTRSDHAYGWGDIEDFCWSDTYQWLPSNVEFQDDGSLKFTSYINNLHPNKYPAIYNTIEKLIEKALPAWDQCLCLSLDRNEKVGAGRLKSRFSRPEKRDDHVAENWDTLQPKSPVYKYYPESDEEDAEYDLGSDDTESEGFQEEREREIEQWRRTRKAVQREPDTFDDGIDFYLPTADGLLSEKFKDSGLQIIVKMASIELTSEKPKFPAGGWHVEGQMNERICATALYYLDSENVSASSLSFRMQTSDDVNEAYMEVGQDQYHWMEQVYGTGLGAGGQNPCLQNYGSVETHEGRLLAFPNVFQHRVSPFELIDPTKPGHRRFIALWLVDPNTRIISTANVPPQQQNWWAESIFSRSKKEKGKAISKMPAELVQILQEKGVFTSSSEDRVVRLPPELMTTLRKHFDADGDKLLMSETEAQEHRLQLMAARSVFDHDTDDHWHQNNYSFCEH